MRLRKGDKVEVMNKTEAPVSWRVAEILSGNGHTYRVQYDPYPGMASEQMVETVSRKFVRPCPPPVQGIDNCIDGDIVEVFYEYAWKIAAILKVLGCKKESRSKKIQYLVRLLGCSQEFIVDESNIRIRQTWQEDKWNLIGKCYRSESKQLFVPFIPACQETDTLCSDAESCYGSGSERKSSSLPLKESRRLELRAYRRTLEALYASGPLSWEQEALLTNLRIMLHISNDEHLMELKHLISKTAIMLDNG
ncbi:UNVERIFIED_CONTAM: hypothetical protein Scaly_2358700 [Sesamum calycinum]|uniref:ENT domain-containing protein n=1 Tax=Sesamum calycinum TaxID=2727403 RepID=A0AAW2M0D8_9LAMI